MAGLKDEDGRCHILIVPDALPSQTKPLKQIITVRQLIPFLHKKYPDLVVLLLSDSKFSNVQLRGAGVRQRLPQYPALPELGLAVQDAAEYLHLKRALSANQQTTDAWRREMLHTKSQLSTLRQTTRAMTNHAERDELLCLILQQAVTLLGGKSGGIYSYDPDRELLTVVAEYGRKINQAKGVTLKKGEGMAGQLVATGEPFYIVDHYADFAGKAGLFAEQRPNNAVVEVLLRLKWQQRVVGVLYVDDEVGRSFTAKDARLLSVFADQAAIAMANADLLLRDKIKISRLQKLSEAASQIMSKLGRVSNEEILNLIAQHATEILEAEAGSILLVRRPGFLSFEAAYGYGKQGIKKGREFKIRTGHRTGLTGHIAQQKKLFNAHGDALVKHPAVRGQETPYMKSRNVMACWPFRCYRKQTVVNLQNC